MTDYNSIILNNYSSISILKGLVDDYLSHQAHLSLSALSRKLGLKSRSNLSDALRGKRSLSRSHWQPLLDILGANQQQIDYILTLLDRELERRPDSQQDLDRRLNHLRRQLEGPLERYIAKLRGLNFALEVYCVFGLFKNKASRQQLISYFGRDRGIDIDRAIARLQQEGLVEPGDGPDTYRYVKDPSGTLLNLYEEGDKNATINYLEGALERSKEELAFWYEKSDEALFAASLLCVNQGTYRKGLKKLKATLLEIQSEMEEGENDMLLHFNIQVFPGSRNRR